MIHITESNVTVMVKDMDESIRFYEQIGFILKNRWESHYAMLSATGITVGLHPSDGNAIGSGNVSIGLMIENLDTGKDLLNQHGIAYRHDDGKSGNYLHFQDPDGTILYFVQPKWRYT